MVFASSISRLPIVFCFQGNIRADHSNGFRYLLGLEDAFNEMSYNNNISIKDWMQLNMNTFIMKNKYKMKARSEAVSNVCIVPILYI